MGLGQTYNQIPQEHGNSNLPNTRDIDARPFLDSRCIKVAEAREVDADRPIAEQLGGNLERLGRHARDDHITERECLLELPVGLLMDLVPRGFDPTPSGEQLHARQIDAVHRRTVIGEQRRQGPAVDLGAVDDGDGLSEEAVPRREDGVVDLEVLEDLDDGEGGAGKDGLLEVAGGVEEADVVVHVVEVLVGEALDILGEGDGLLDVLVVGRIVREDGVVDDDAVYGVVFVGGCDGFLEFLLIDLAQVEGEAAGRGDWELAPAALTRKQLGGNGKGTT